MKSLILAATLFAAVAAPAMAQINVTIGQPNFYGRIDMGGYSQAPVLYAQRPIVINEQRHYGAPVYLRVPEGHRRHWNRHCAQYGACDQQVLFVQDGWYSNTYVPQYREQHGPRSMRASNERDENRGHGHGEGRGHDDRGRDEGRGHDEHGHGRHGN